jgi:O-methyltransferase involved in polyketide biosynthesis
VEFCPIDFEHISLAEGLAKSSLDHAATAFFSWLGVTQYLNWRRAGGLESRIQELLKLGFNRVLFGSGRSEKQWPALERYAALIRKSV